MDTVVVLDGNNNQTTLRLAEVDSPESGQPFGKSGKQFTSTQVFGKSVKYYITDSDPYGRIMQKFITKMESIYQKKLLKQVLGYYQYSDNKNLGKIQDIAKNKKVALWSNSQALPP